MMWLALALLGQIAALRLIDAGPLIHYQHYRLPGAAFANPQFRWALAIVAAQAVLVCAGLLIRRSKIMDGMRTLGPAWRIAGAFAVLLCAAAAVSRDRFFFAEEWTFGAAIQLLNCGNIFLAACDFPARGVKAMAERFNALVGGEWKQRVTIDRFALCAALWIAVVSSFFAWLVYQVHPHVADEVAYLYNARYFAAGEMAMPSPPDAEAFDVDLMDYQPNQWFSAVPLGWPAMLAAGEKLHAAWLVNPVLGGINALLIYLIVGGLYSRRTARIAVLLLCASPWYLFMAMSYMNHIATLFCALVAFWAILQARAKGILWPLIAGLGVGATSLIRPLDGAIAGLLVAAWALGIGGTRLRFAGLAALAAGIVLAGAVQLPYNKRLTGNALSSPLTAYQDKHYKPKSNAYGFGPERGLGWAIDPYPGHTPFEAVILAELNAHSLNTDLFGWSTGSLLLVGAGMFFAKLRKADHLMLAVIATVLLAYAPYWTNGGPDFGARYWFLILVPCIALSAQGLEALYRHNDRAIIAIALLCLLGFLVYIPWRSVDKYYHYLRMRPDVRELARENHFGRSLVFVRGERFPDYMSAAIYNPLDLHADAPIYVWDRSPEVHERVMTLYRDRPVWTIDGPTLTGGGYKITSGPSTAEILH
ncbi:MAG: glycosyltransferase family 39 protein [Bryobacterales bacterium]|nr:glycosyltransferase family 39 protein [Bryobacterales bacterium]MBV9396383.1 glycosyltransferase family 39 protein [Bryobacterales bacterium]